jgi:Ser-tRNA(Ala) deacylase AlaX
MRKVFWKDPYQTELHTRVKSVHGDEVLFEETIAYSFSGGQESDRATVNDLTILDSRMEGGLIFYRLPSDHGLKLGDEVLMKIDWPRRYKLMRLHFAAELILEMTSQQFFWEKVGAHISEHKARIDFRCQENISAAFPQILEAYEKIIEADLPIEKGFSDEKNQRRYWKIGGFAEVPCGGTHVKSTGEVGRVRLKRENPGKGLQRVEIYLLNL